MSTTPAEPEPEPEPEIDDAPPHRGVPGRVGCLIALGGALVLGGGSLGAAYWMLRARTGPVLVATDELAKVFKAAEGAPGVQAVRDLGCDQAGAFEVAPLRDLTQRLENGRAAKEKRAPEAIDLGDQPTVVKCWMKRVAGPTCEEVAHTFAEAAHPVRGFTVAVENPRGPVCAESYQASAERIGPTKNPNVPPLAD